MFLFQTLDSYYSGYSTAATGADTYPYGYPGYVNTTLYSSTTAGVPSNPTYHLDLPPANVGIGQSCSYIRLSLATL